MKIVLVRFALVCFGLLLTVGLAEAALRVLPLPDLRPLAAGQAPPAATWKDRDWGDPPDRAFRRHRVVGHEHAPNVDVTVRLVEHAGGGFRFRTNNLGLRRDDATEEDKPADTYRVLVLGDSQTDGYIENAESFSTLLEARLAGRLTGGRRLEVLNAGVAGYSPAQELLWYDVHGEDLRPDLVLVVFYPGNDVLDLLDHKKPNVDPATGRVIRPVEEDDDPQRGDAVETLRLGLLARYAVQVGPLAGTWQRLELPGRLVEAGGYPTHTLTQVFKSCHGCYLQSLQQAARARREPAVMADAQTRAAAILTRLKQQVVQNGGRLVVAVLPTRPQVEPELARPAQQMVASLLGLEESDLAFDDAVVESLRRRLTTVDVPLVILREHLASAASDEALYYSRDWHLNARGHQVAAEGLVRALAPLVGATP